MKTTKALVFSPVSLWDVHHADTIELLHFLNDLKKKIYLVVCYGDLHKCAPNPDHLLNKCHACNKINFYSAKKLIPEGTELIPLIIKNEIIKINKITPKSFFNLKYENLPVGRLVSSDFAHDLVSYYFYKNWDSKIGEAEKRAANAIGLYNFMKSTIIKHQIDEVYAWNGRRPSDGPALYAAQSLKKKYFSFICGGEPGQIFIAPATSVQDFSVTLKNLKKIRSNLSPEMMKIGRNFIQVYVAGTCRQIGYRQFYKRKKLELKKDKKNLLLVTSSPQEQMHLEEVYRFFGFKPFEKIFSFVNNPEITNTYNVTIRWHPRKAESRSFDKKIIQELAKENPSIRHIYPESKIKTEYLVQQADIIIGSGSTLCLYAVLLKKPVILFGPWSSFFGKSAYVVDSPKDLCRLLKKRLVPRPCNDALALAYYQNSFGQKNRHVLFKEQNGKRRIYLKKPFFGTARIHPSKLYRWILNFLPLSFMKKSCAENESNKPENKISKAASF